MKVLLVPVEAQKKLKERKRKLDSATDQERTDALIRRIIKFAKLLRLNKIPVHTSNERDASRPWRISTSITGFSSMSPCGLT